MKKQNLAPTGKSQDFEINETFFSTTDTSGTITAGNRIFERTSGYSSQELLGSPHNLIRHPEMPRCVFALLWSHIRAEKPFSGYVKNQAKNGNHYWVFALIEALPNELLSIRIKPSSALFETIPALYEKLLTTENRVLEDGLGPKAAMRESESVLLSQLSALGYENYESFSQSCLNLEIKSRDKIVGQRALSLLPNPTQENHQNSYSQASSAYRKLGGVFAAIDRFLNLSESIHSSQEKVVEMASDFRNYALNANIAATQIGSSGATIDTITQFLHKHAGEFSNNASLMAELTANTQKTLAEINARLASARIQLEMLISFLAETSNSEGSHQHEGLKKEIGSLKTAFSATAKTAYDALTTLKNQLPPLLKKKADLQKTIISFNVAQINGLMECSRLKNAETLTTMFAELRKQIEKAKTQLDKTDSVTAELASLANSTPGRIREVVSSLAS